MKFESGFADILNESERQAFLEGVDILDGVLFDRLFEYYTSRGEMPYGTAKARTGDPWVWIMDQLNRESRYPS